MAINKTIKLISASILTTIIGVLLIVYNDATIETIKSCLNVCTNTLIPSLFAFMLLCSILIGSGLGEYITFPLWYIFRKIIRLDRKTFSVFFLSQIAGYPTGIKMLNDLIAHNKNYTAIAQKISFVCFSSGPAFVTGIVGSLVFQNINAGLICYLSSVMANFISAALITRKISICIKDTGIDLNNNFSVSTSMLSTAKAMLIVCISMIMFNTLYSLFSCLFDFDENKLINLILKAVFEVTNIKNLAECISIPLATFIVSFGGLCVIYQIKAISDFKLNISKFISARLIISALSAIISEIIVLFSGFELSVNVAVGYHYPDILVENPVVLVCILIMTAFTLTIIKKFQ